MKSFLNPAAVAFLAAILITPIYSQSGGADAYKANCAMCHGADGLGATPVGKAMKAASFKDPVVVKAPDTELIEIVTKGKNKMPAYKGKLSDAQIKATVAYVRTLQK